MKGIKDNSPIVYYIFLSGFLLFSSCNNKTKKKEEKNSTSQIEIKLPDSLQMNTEMEGEIIYRSDFDTVRLKNGEKRYIYLYLSEGDSPLSDFRELKKQEMDTFVPINDEHLIPVYNIVFEKSGKKFINGVLVDQIFKNEEEGNVKITTLETKVIHPIVIYD
ncbi:hypothetical protein ED312_15720 [Sinomicrobium pectinilyticum]|uniref:Lipoprotein n=1 Tax=Sinomicrobium pectinilyticum TaxID=1084421 RepID=A0A3N0E5I7_SINP1|nr:hypothetical protein [Sinomicrobium pectinilyticum]RNL83110.1 hypothetical protein ED312_15720 [Sinomicrobium pectinilyticum]